MKISFDGARKQLARSHNDLVESIRSLDIYGPKWEQEATLESLKENADRMRESVGAFLCMYDDSVEGDMTMLADDVELEPFFSE